MKKSLITILLGFAITLVSASGVLAATVTTGSALSLEPATSTADHNNANNANQTGKGVDGQSTVDPLSNVVKSLDMVNNDKTSGNQKTHGEYQSNTNSCASCHQTHTGSDSALLFKEGNYATCTACHDGTLGFYNVFKPSSAGLFNGEPELNASMHMANGETKMSAAPGGNRASADTQWGAAFDCASCHAPHGSYSDRLLNYNPNSIGTTPLSAGGLQVTTTVATSSDAIPLVTAVTKDSPRAIIVKLTAADKSTAKITEPGDAYVVYTRITEQAGYIRDNSPWIAKQSTFAGIAADQLIINNVKGYAVVKDSSTPTEIKISRAVKVKFNMVPDTTDSNGIAKVVLPSSYDPGTKDMGLNISLFCASCHTDYLAKRSDGGKTGSEDGTGMWSQAFRHTTASDGYSCLKCHFAHGSDASVMMDANNRDIADLKLAGFSDTDAVGYMTDKSPDSALKRYTNMSVCWKCHSKSHNDGLIQNEWMQGAGIDVPTGWTTPPATPGTQGRP